MSSLHWEESKYRDYSLRASKGSHTQSTQGYREMFTKRENSTKQSLKKQRLFRSPSDNLGMAFQQAYRNMNWNWFCWIWNMIPFKVQCVYLAIEGTAVLKSYVWSCHMLFRYWVLTPDFLCHKWMYLNISYNIQECGLLQQGRAYMQLRKLSNLLKYWGQV